MAAFSALSLCPHNFSCRPNPNKRRFLCSLASPSSIGTRGPKVPRKKSGRLEGAGKSVEDSVQRKLEMFMKGLMVHLSVSSQLEAWVKLG
ncbi:unnamed protein product [Camellia sinensis]